MTVTAIIQARLHSTRLPRKVIMDIEGKPMLQRVIEQVKKAKLVDGIIVAIPFNDEDSDALIPIATACGVFHYLHRPGNNENDVLDRFYQAAPVNARAIVRITADCPLVDPTIIDRAIQYFLDHNIDYVYSLPPYPDGLDVEVFSYETLVRAKYTAITAQDKEHVTTIIRNHPEAFKIGHLDYKEDLSLLKWSVDTSTDLEFVRHIYKELGEDFHLEDILRLIKEEE